MMRFEASLVQIECAVQYNYLTRPTSEVTQPDLTRPNINMKLWTRASQLDSFLHDF